MWIFMTVLLPKLSFLTGWVAAFVVLLIRYFLIAGFAFLTVHFIFKKQLTKRKIQQKVVPNRMMSKEIKASIISFIIFGACMSMVIYFTQQGLTKIYNDINRYPPLYTAGSFILLLFIHDTYFYWLHRLMHLPVLYKYVHYYHHKSVTPTPFTAFSFHPIEAFLEFSFIVPIVFIIPLHIVVLILFAFAMTAMNVFGHLGYELFPIGFLKTPIGKIFNTTTHHDMHHHYNKCNYGLYFNFWDNIMHTNHKKYRQTFENRQQKINM